MSIWPLGRASYNLPYKSGGHGGFPGFAGVTFTEEDIVSKIKDCLLERDYDFELVETLTINSFRFCLGNTKHGVYVIDEDGSWTFELTNDDLLNDVLIEDEDGFLFSKGFIDLLDLDALYNSLQTYNNLTQKPRFWF